MKCPNCGNKLMIDCDGDIDYDHKYIYVTDKGYCPKCKKNYIVEFAYKLEKYQIKECNADGDIVEEK